MALLQHVVEFRGLLVLAIHERSHHTNTHFVHDPEMFFLQENVELLLRDLLVAEFLSATSVELGGVSPQGGGDLDRG